MPKVNRRSGLVILDVFTEPDVPETALVLLVHLF